MKKINISFTEAKNYFIFHQPHFLFLLIFGLTLLLFSTLPYFNIILVPELIITFFFLMSVIVFKFNETKIFYSALGLLILIPFFFSIKNNFLAEKTGDIAFFILIIGFLKSFWRYLKEIKTRSEKLF